MFSTKSVLRHIQCIQGYKLNITFINFKNLCLVMNLYFYINSNCFASSELPINQNFKICTQNLFRYGEKQGNDKIKQRNYLVDRIVNARCDVIALQEVFGEDKKTAKRKLRSLQKALFDVTGDEYEFVIGDGFDLHIRNGFLYKKHSSKFIEHRSFHNTLLPKLQPLGPNERHLRDPLMLVLAFSQTVKTDNMPVYLLLLNFHLKSKHKGFHDPSGTNFETTRMESSESLRLLLDKEIKNKEIEFPNAKIIPIMLGDRNANENSASALIMRGEMKLSNFTRGGVCGLDDLGTPSCTDKTQEADIKYIGMVEMHNKLNPMNPLHTYVFRKKKEIIDDILVKVTQSQFFSKCKRPVVGVLGEPYRGSDHNLVWVTLNIESQC